MQKQVIQNTKEHSKVMVFGSFDVLHPGHLHFFREAKKLGDYLIVVVGRDKTVKEVKGNEPLYSEEDRLACVNALRIVDKAVLGYVDNQFMVLDEFKPDIICLGYDQKSFITERLEEEIRERGLIIRIVRLMPYKEHRFKSSKMKKL